MNNSPNDFYVLKSIGTIHTPYKDKAPHQSIKMADGEFLLIIKNKFLEGLKSLDRFKYIYVIYYLDKVLRNNSMLVTPPFSKNKTVGLFASRSPNRPNPIGISIVAIKRIEKNHIYISGIDAFDGTSIIDIKPYIKDLDSKEDANYGWLDEKDNKEHLDLHIKGIPHKH